MEAPINKGTKGTKDTTNTKDTKDIKITDYSETKIVPKCKNPDAQKLLPTIVVPIMTKFVLHNVNNSIAAGLRRTMACELPVKYLAAGHENIDTNDKHILPEMLINDLKSIPIKQNIGNVTFNCKVENLTVMPMDVKSRDLKSSDGKDYFNETFTICTLQPGRYITINKVGISTGIGYIKGDGNTSLASSCSCTPADVLPLSSGGKSCSVSNPRVWDMSFIAHGTMDPSNIVVMACESLIERVEKVLDIAPVRVGNNYYIRIEESATIGNLFMRTIIDLYPRIPHVRFTEAALERVVTLEISCDEDVEEIIKFTHDHIINIFKKIKSLI